MKWIWECELDSSASLEDPVTKLQDYVALRYVLLRLFFSWWSVVFFSWWSVVFFSWWSVVFFSWWSVVFFSWWSVVFFAVKSAVERHVNIRFLKKREIHWLAEPLLAYQGLGWNTSEHHRTGAVPWRKGSMCQDPALTRIPIVLRMKNSGSRGGFHHWNR